MRSLLLKSWQRVSAGAIMLLGLLSFQVNAQPLFNSIADAEHASEVETAIHQLSGRSIFGWLNQVQETPDFSQHWDALTPKQAHGFLQDDVQVFYLDEPEEALNILRYRENKQDRYALDLRSHTVFEFPNGVDYLGIYYEREYFHQDPLTFVFTLSNGEKKEFFSCTSTEELMKFTGFITNDDVNVVRMEVIKPMGTGYAINDFSWGTKKQMNLMACGFQPMVTAVECGDKDDKRWLVDVEVSKMETDSESWWCANDQDSLCGNYGETISFGYFSKSQTPMVDILFQDQKNNLCNAYFTLNEEKLCSTECQAYFSDLEENDELVMSKTNLELMRKCQGVLSPVQLARRD